MRTLFFIVAAVAAIGVAWNVTQDNAPDSEISKRLLFPQLMNVLNDVNEISVAGSDNTIDLRDADGNWVVTNRDDFPADISKVRSTLLELAQARVVESKTNKPEHYAKIGVNTPDSPDSTSFLINASSAQDKLISLIVGNKRSNSQPGTPQYFVREVDSSTALLVQAGLELNADPTQWMDTEIVDIAAERVRSVTIGKNKTKPIVVSKQQPDENFYSLANIPEGFTAASRSVVSSFGALLLGVRFDNVLTAKKIEGENPRTTSMLETFDGLRATIEQFDYEDSLVTRFRFTYDPELVEPADTEPEDQADGENPSPELDTEPSVQSSIEELNRRVQRWVYVLPDYKSRLLAKTFDEMIKVEESETSGDDDQDTPE
ncbi:MAG: DUF4340 domain-containing protein [Gammaproteobacteria bacterium]